MVYLMWTEREISGLRKYKGIVTLYTEVSEGGGVVREVGVDEEKKIVHFFPSERDQRGLFDLGVIETGGLRSDLAASEFEMLWREAVRLKSTSGPKR